MAIKYTGTARSDRLVAKSVAPYDQPIVMKGHGGGDELIGGFLQPNRLYGGRGNDTLYGGADTNLLSGGVGDDVLNARQGAWSALRGGAGDDHLTVGIWVICWMAARGPTR